MIPDVMDIKREAPRPATFKQASEVYFFIVLSTSQSDIVFYMIVIGMGHVKNVADDIPGF